MRLGKHSVSEINEDGHYWISISDLMTSLLFIFILILAYTIYTFSEKTTQLTEDFENKNALLTEIQQELNEKSDQLSESYKKREEMLAELQHELNEKSSQFTEGFENRSILLTELQIELQEDNINVDIDPKNGNMRIKSDGLFDTGSADLSPQGQYALVKIAQAIKLKMQEPKFHKAIDTIFIEGHTDNVPISGGKGRRWTNMELSAQRAINTFLIMDKGADIGEMSNRDGNYLFSYSGYADQRPRATNETETGRAKNRRIELFFALTSPQLYDLNKQN